MTVAALTIAVLLIALAAFLLGVGFGRVQEREARRGTVDLTGYKRSSP